MGGWGVVWASAEITDLRRSLITQGRAMSS